ncbi:MAG: 1-(5-phosphoribosyl)-5-[(5-phosphoribosylamino)methylideneamino] imidazole-4-carboxamide isomerase [Acidobacteriota bacterium]|nr:1-(5-phosphoribosyl)-5-[(5-phosphoribosylamino)methylideneamino] imidazole-4-carboxamide isomerase [Acidobacteriota bacterium]MDE3043298.1 1-(5-phosphoribosyl)-5-[(5-phosphoribosylamino)methylideneamino] imidazole-4-carboxamide isomerase [Acidobacteriota bacterium]MDE3107736.1 1-(5-phosphoribosyl)-5-[(5-phosphoribosylamino)methylideneamino] imidazole-4-carboxamide isomerase [Acidobacteriota bacterium]MDE3222400.1 1-(5-phosphoribosyl)-5-[(5-phosphoribosylamino)methylideneamino] imidazole-4-car
MQLLPALDVLGDDAVRLERGDFDRVLFRQPLEAMLTRVLATNPSLVHVVDLQGARDGTLREDVLQRCVALAASTPVQFSGGLRDVASARRALELGAARVIVGTALWQREDALDEFVAAIGQQLVAALDVREGRVAVRGWVDSSGVSLDEALARCRDAGVARLHVTAIERDGTMRGPDLALYERAVASGLAVVAAGGVRDDQDVAALAALGCEAAVMGLGYLARLGLTLDDLQRGPLT